MLRVRYFFFFEDFIYLFVERQEGREKERERNIDVGEKIRLVASCMPPTGDLARNPGLCPGWDWTSDLSIHRPVLNPLSYTLQGRVRFVCTTMGSLQFCKCGDSSTENNQFFRSLPKFCKHWLILSCPALARTASPSHARPHLCRKEFRILLLFDS